jgi:Kef-type K+ transport system membrane component KefB
MKRVLGYTIAVCLPVAMVLVLLQQGSRLYPAAAAADRPAAPGSSLEMLSRQSQPLAVLLLQIVVILMAARLLGLLFERLGQPAVIGEVVAGLLLGPSFLGWAVPEVKASLFPSSSLGALRLFAEVGVILFMFLVGMELEPRHLRPRVKAAILVSHCSIAIPFVLGVALALAVFPWAAPAQAAFVPFALFLGMAMSITAFPVLARILEDRGLSKTALGMTAIACAAVDDVTAWCLLALVIAIVQEQSLGNTGVTLLLSGTFAAVMLLAVRPAAVHLGNRLDPHLPPNRSTAAVILAFVFLCALTTEIIGIHSIFGAFLAGMVLPAQAAFRRGLRERLEAFASVALMPLYFAFTGLRTEVTLLLDPGSLLLGLTVLAVAVAGKLGGSLLAARLAGIGWREAFALGALMNTRGLVELIVLNIGYDLGIISARIYTVMVLMALITTLMTGPLLQIARLDKTPLPHAEMLH